MGQPISGRTPCFVRLRLEHQHCFCSVPSVPCFCFALSFFLVFVAGAPRVRAHAADHRLRTPSPKKAFSC